MVTNKQKKVPTHMHSQDINPRSHPPFTYEFFNNPLGTLLSGIVRTIF